MDLRPLIEVAQPHNIGLGIPLEKLTVNDGLHVTPTEIKQALEQIRKRPMLVGQRPLPDRESRGWKITFSAWAATAAFIVFGSSPASIVFAVVATGFILVSQWLGRPNPRTALIGFFVALWLGYLVDGYYYPQRLPDASVALTVGSDLHGAMLATTSDGLYVIPSHRNLVFVPTHDVQMVTTKPTKTRRPPILAVELWEAVFG